MHSKFNRRIYLRHAEKEYSNGYSDIFKHDPGITDYGYKRTKKIAEKLIENFGIPDKIVCSPYKRTRETAMVLNSCLPNPHEEIFIDPTLSEYLGNHSNVPLDVTDHTKYYNPPHPETFEEMLSRVKKHNSKSRRKALDLFNQGTIWYITHGLIIKQLANMIGIKLNKQFPCLTAFSILEQSDMIKTEVLLFNQEKNDLENKWFKKKHWKPEFEKTQFTKPQFTKPEFTSNMEMENVKILKRN